MTTQVLTEILQELDREAREYDHYDYGLPLHDEETTERMLAILAKLQSQAGAVPEGWQAQAIDALREGLSVCMSVMMSRDRKIRREGCTLYAQTEEWCRWLEAEVGPQIRSTLDALSAAPAPPQPADEVRRDAKTHKEMAEEYMAWMAYYDAGKGDFSDFIAERMEPDAALSQQAKEV